MSRDERKTGTSGAKTTTNAKTQQQIENTTYINSVLGDAKARLQGLDSKTKQKIDLVKNVTNWEAVDILRVLEENNNDPQLAINSILDGTAGNPTAWMEVQSKRQTKPEGKPKKDKPYTPREGGAPRGGSKPGNRSDQNGSTPEYKKRTPQQGGRPSAATKTGPKTYLKTDPVPTVDTPQSQPSTTSQQESRPDAQNTVEGQQVHDQQQQPQKPSTTSTPIPTTTTATKETSVTPSQGKAPLQQQQQQATKPQQPVVTGGWARPPPSVLGKQPQLPVQTKSNATVNVTSTQQVHKESPVVPTPTPTPVSSVTLPEQSKWSTPLLTKQAQTAAAAAAAAAPSATQQQQVSQVSSTHQQEQQQQQAISSQSSTQPTQQATNATPQQQQQSSSTPQQRTDNAQTQQASPTSRAGPTSTSSAPSAAAASTGKTWKMKEGTSPNQTPKAAETQQQPSSSATQQQQQPQQQVPTQQAPIAQPVQPAQASTTAAKNASAAPQRNPYSSSPVVLPASSHAAISNLSSYSDIQFGVFGTAPTSVNTASNTQKDSYGDVSQLRNNNRTQQSAYNNGTNNNVVDNTAATTDSRIEQLQNNPSLDSYGQVNTMGMPNEPESMPTHLPYSYLPHGAPYIPFAHQYPYDASDSMRPMMHMYDHIQQPYQPNPYPRDVSPNNSKFAQEQGYNDNSTGSNNASTTGSNKFNSSQDPSLQSQAPGQGQNQQANQPQHQPYHYSQYYGFPAYIPNQGYPAYQNQHSQYVPRYGYQRPYPAANYPSSSTAYPPSSSAYVPEEVHQEYKGFPTMPPSTFAMPDSGMSMMGKTVQPGQQSTGAVPSSNKSQSAYSPTPSAPPSGPSNADLSGNYRSQQNDQYKSYQPNAHARDTTSFYNIPQQQYGHQAQSNFPFVQMQQPQYPSAPRGSNQYSQQ